MGDGTLTPRRPRFYLIYFPRQNSSIAEIPTVRCDDFTVTVLMSNNYLSEAIAGIPAPPLQARASITAGAGNGRERRLIISSRLADGYQLTEIGLKNLQHVFTVWFPRAVYHDLTDDTVRVDIVVRKGWASGRGVFATSFLRADGSVAKVVQYDEDRFVGKTCDHYDQKKSGYAGKKDGIDYRIAVYASEPVTVDRRG